MAISKRPGRTWSIIHFLIRFLGLTGLLVGCVGLVLAGLDGLLTSWSDLTRTVNETLSGTHPRLSAYLLLSGGLAVVLALLVESLNSVSHTAVSRSGLGVNTAVQVVLAGVLLVGVNVWSSGLKLDLFGWKVAVPGHYERIDLTRDQAFTLAGPAIEQLKKLQGETTVVVLQQHQTNGTFVSKPDQFDAAAERKVVEKVRDLVEQLRELIPQESEEGATFRVEVLDTHEGEAYYKRLEALGKKNPELRAAIEAAPENSIFFASNRFVQQMSFNDFYRLNKTASEKANDRHGNLVLNARGAGPILKRILNLEERTPVVGVLVIHEALTTEGAADWYTLRGLGDSLRSSGFDVRDLVLKRLQRGPAGQGGTLVAAVDLLEDSRLDRLQDEHKRIENRLKNLDLLLTRLDELATAVQDPKKPLREINRLLVRSGSPWQLRGDEGRKVLLEIIQEEQSYDQRRKKKLLGRQDEVARELEVLNTDQAGERRRLNDLKAKFDRFLSECDLVVVPRLTVEREGSPVAEPRLHDLDEQLVAALRDYLRAGKPILACFGTRNLEEGPADPPDELEKLLADLGVFFSKRTVLFDAEASSFTGERQLFRSQPLDLPVLQTKGSAEHDLWPDKQKANQRVVTRRDMFLVGSWLAGPSVGPLPAVLALAPEPPPLPERSINPVRKSLDLVGECLGTSRGRTLAGASNAEEERSPLRLILRKPRPVAVDPELARKLPYETVILATAKTAWNDDHPFSTPGRPEPEFEIATGFDPDAGTLDEKRQGAFPVAVAFETAVPDRIAYPQPTVQAVTVLGLAFPDPGLSRLTQAGVAGRLASLEMPRRERVRVVAIGSGSVFSGKQVPPGEKQLLLDCCNWLLGRNDRLAERGQEWSYPRVSMSERDKAIWLWTCWLGLPMVFAYLGTVVLLSRRLR